MPRSARKASSTDVYHVMALMDHGVSRQLIFENNIDRKKFLDVLSKHASKNEMSAFVYCLRFFVLLPRPLFFGKAHKDERMA